MSAFVYNGRVEDTKKMQWTERQLKAIEKQDSNLLVSAAAGSGKTAVLVERVKRLILEQDVGVDELLVVTFTNAAASEMKEKIYLSLNLELLSGKGDQDRITHLHKQISTIGNANISTFHAFAYEVVRRYYHVIGKPPGLALCDETRQSLLQSESMDELLEECFERGDPGFLTFLDRYATVKSDQAVRELIFMLHRFLQSLADPEAWMQKQTARLEQPSLAAGDPVLDCLSKRVICELSWARAYLEQTRSILCSQTDEEGLPLLSGLASKNECDIEAVQELLNSARHENVFTFAQTLSKQPAFTQMRATAAEKPYYDEVLKAHVTALRDVAKKRLKALSALLERDDANIVLKEYEAMRPIAHALFQLVRDFDRIYAEKKAKNNLLDFSDLERFALQILDNPEVQKEYRERFRYIFIDEYQDSNGVQDALIQKLCRRDNVFMVGDVKQSIYKFRLAEPELFIEKYVSYRSGGSDAHCVVDLNSNFRSKQNIIDAVNELFSVLMHEESTGMAYDEDAALIKGSPYEGSLDEKAVLYIVGTESDSEDIDEEIADLKATELEALWAVNVIKNQVGRMVFDDKKGCERPLGYRDMAVLMRAVTGNGEVFYRAFADAGIPVILERNEGYFNTVEIQLFLNLLRIIDNRKQDIPLLSVLRSPVFGFSADELAEIRIFATEALGVRCPYSEAFFSYAATGRQSDLKQKCDSFLSNLSVWRDWALHRPLGDFMAALMNDTHYQIFARAVPGGAQRHANLRALIDKAEAFESENYGGLQEFIRHAEFLADRKSRADVGQAGLLAEGADAVRIMTIHKSKGLEFPFVLLAGLGKRLRFSNAAPQAVLHKDLGIGFRLVDDAHSTFTDSLSHQMIADRLREEELAESIRVLYVAMTRPMDRLAMIATARKPEDILIRAKAVLPGDVQNASSYLDMILPALEKHIEIVLIGKEQLSKASVEQRSMQDELHKRLTCGFYASAGESPVDSATSQGVYMHDLTGTCFPLSADAEPVKMTVTQMAALASESARPGMRLSAGEQDEGWEGTSAIEPFAYAVPKFLAPGQRLTAAEKGTAYHSVLERIPLSSAYEHPEVVQRFIDELVCNRLLSAEEASAVQPGKIASFFQSKTGHRLLSASNVQREAPFVVELEYDGQRKLVQGAIDCYFQEEDGWVLIDFKSSAVDSGEWAYAKQRFSRLYDTQMRLYKEALESVTGILVKEVILYAIAAEDSLTMYFQQPG